MHELSTNDYPGKTQLGPDACIEIIISDIAHYHGSAGQGGDNVTATFRVPHWSGHAEVLTMSRP